MLESGKIDIKKLLAPVREELVSPVAEKFAEKVSPALQKAVEKTAPETAKVGNDWCSYCLNPAISWFYVFYEGEIDGIGSKDK